MSMRSKFHNAIRSLLMGRGLSSACDLPLHSPQTEVAVWLHGLGEPRDITASHSVACPIPFTICVGFEEHELLPRCPNQHVKLRVVERAGSGRLLGEIELEHQEMLCTDGTVLRLYRATSCTNLCVTRLRGWTRALYVTAERWIGVGSGRAMPSALDGCCNEVVFICPRPVVLVSLRYANGRGNIFPMNLMGQVGRDCFVFALNRDKQAAPAVTALTRVAISTVPIEKAEQVRRLGKNHRQSSIDWAELPFATCPSPSLGIPVPDFALTVRELMIEHSMPLGSHTFFIARVVSRHVYSESPEFHRIHGLYAAKRDRGSAAG